MIQKQLEQSEKQLLFKPVDESNFAKYTVLETTDIVSILTGTHG